MRAAVSFIATLFFTSCAFAATNSPLLARVAGYPECANPCLANYQTGGCDALDYTCLCKSEVFLDSTAQCLYDNCSSASDIAEALKTSQLACLSAGVSLTSTYTPTQSLHPSTSAGGASLTPSGSTTPVESGTSTPSGATSTPAPSSASGTSSAAPTPTPNAASSLFQSQSGLGLVGAAVLAALAL